MDSNKSASAQLREMTEIFSTNLRRLTREFGSIAEVSAQSGVNRQQFNKYLAGENLPSVPILIKICAVFGVGLDDIMSVTDTEAMEEMSFGNLIHSAQSPADTISIGHYLEITKSEVAEDSYLISMSEIRPAGQRRRYFRKNRMTNVIPDDMIWSYAGYAHTGRDAAMIVYVNTFTKENYGTYFLRRANYYGFDLHGLKLGISAHVPGRPFTAPIYLRYLGTEIDEDEIWPKCRITPRAELDKETLLLIDHMNSRVEQEEGPIIFSGG